MRTEFWYSPGIKCLQSYAIQCHIIVKISCISFIEHYSNNWIVVPLTTASLLYMLKAVQLLLPFMPPRQPVCNLDAIDRLFRSWRPVSWLKPVWCDQWHIKGDKLGWLNKKNRFVLTHLPPGQNGHHFGRRHFQMNLLNENGRIPI